MLKKSILLFDGVCNLCNSSIQVVIARDKKEMFQFSSLQSDFSKQKLKQFGLEKEYLNTLVLIDGDRVLTRSDAVLEVLKKLGGGWQLFYIFKIIPKSIRDVVYDWIAKNRYLWFGKKDHCMIPTRELRERFID